MSFPVPVSAANGAKALVVGDDRRGADRHQSRGLNEWDVAECFRIERPFSTYQAIGLTLNAVCPAACLSRSRLTAPRLPTLRSLESADERTNAYVRPTPTRLCSARWVTATRIRRKKPSDYRGVGHSNFPTVRASKALGVIGRTDDRHLTQRRERPSPRHASARRKLSL